jgi:hypothetical protein
LSVEDDEDLLPTNSTVALEGKHRNITAILELVLLFRLFFLYVGIDLSNCGGIRLKRRMSRVENLSRSSIIFLEIWTEMCLKMLSMFTTIAIWVLYNLV